MKRNAAMSTLSDVVATCLAKEIVARQSTSAQKAWTKNVSSFALANRTTETITIAVDAKSTATSM